MADHPVEATIEIQLGYDPKLPNPQTAPPVPIVGDPDTLPPRDPKTGRFRPRSQPPSARPTPTPPPSSAQQNQNRNHPDNPPSNMWPGVDNEALRRRYWRERRQRISRSLRMESARQAREAKANAATQAKHQRRRKSVLKRRRTRSQASIKAANRDQQKFQARLHRIRRRRLTKMSKRGAAARSLGRSMGSSIGAGIGARAAGPWGAAAGSWIGGHAGGSIGGGMAGMSLGAGAATGVIAGAVISAGLAYKAYDVAHKALNTTIAEGVVPFGKSLLHSIPVISNFTGTVEATFKRFEADKAKYQQFSPQLQQMEKFNDVALTLSRMRNARQREDGVSLDDQMSQISRLRNRFQVANEGIEAELSRVIYTRLIPLIEKGVVIWEALSKDANVYIAAVDGFISGFGQAIIDAIKAVIGSLPFGAKAVVLIEKAIAAADVQLKRAADEEREKQKEIVKLMGDKIQSNLFGIINGWSNVEMTPEQRKAFEDMVKGFGPNKPAGFAGFGMGNI